MNKVAFQIKLSDYLVNNVPFIFMIDFEEKSPFICKLEEATENDILFDIKGFSNFTSKNIENEASLTAYPIDEQTFSKKIQKVKDHTDNGDTYLLNLTFKTKISTNLSLKEIFQLSNAPYKLYFKNKWVCFSPESFIQIKSDKIYSFPMKGTIDAQIEDAEQKLLSNSKELWEHNTIVDLLRNDLSIISHDVNLNKFRFIDHIKTNKNEILQTSSEIEGKLPEGWRKTFGSDLFKLLPAGSISGAPKQKTTELISTIEEEERGFYTGVFGYYDGEQLDSAVIIRYIQQENNQLFFRSGGGITSNSVEQEEYQELIQKIYIPIAD